MVEVCSSVSCFCSDLITFCVDVCLVLILVSFYSPFPFTGLVQNGLGNVGMGGGGGGGGGGARQSTVKSYAEEHQLGGARLAMFL